VLQSQLGTVLGLVRLLFVTLRSFRLPFAFLPFRYVPFPLLRLRNFTLLSFHGLALRYLHGSYRYL